MRKILQILISLTVVPIAIFSVQRFSEKPIGSTAIWWLVELCILTIFLVGRFVFFEHENKKHFKIIKWYLVWIIFCLIRGIFMAEMYWDYKALIDNMFTLLLPVVAYTASNTERLQSILSYFIKYALPISPLFLYFLPMGAWGWYFFPIGLLIIFFPVLNRNWKIALFAISLIVMLGDITTRSHLVKYSVPILIVLLYYFRIFIFTTKTLDFIRRVFLFAPWLLFILGVLGIFNVFKINQYIKGDFDDYKVNSEGEIVQGIATDSRTFIYQEVLQSAKKYNYWLLGRSPARGNETFAFAEFTEQITGRNERFRNEANVPNVFTWMGIVGVIFYFSVFIKSSYLAINRSRNIFSKLIGVFVAFRWTWAWIEDAALFDMNNFVIWLLIGICLSNSFRKMNNAEVILWARGIFDAKYIKYGRYFKENTLKNVVPELN